VHLVLLLVLVVIPLASDIIAPIPLVTMSSYMLAAPLPPPPAVTPSAVAARPLESAAAVAPTRAPEKILPEQPAPQPTAPLGPIDGGLPVGLGVAGAVPSALDVPLPAPPPPPTPRAPVRAAQLPEQPRKLVDARPVYPEVARTARIEGTVILEAVLDTGGRVTQLRVLRSVPMLDQAALDAVRQWRYSPTIYYGHPVSVLMTITVRFTLQ
jgi:protein TonB